MAQGRYIERGLSKELDLDLMKRVKHISFLL